MKNFIIGILLAAAFGLSGMVLVSENQEQLSSVQTGYVEDTISAPTHASTTINTTSTQVFSSITRFGTIQNTTESEIYCKVDTAGITAASSTVNAQTAYVIGKEGLTTSTLPSAITFGECWPGAYNCIPAKGTINCLASAAAVVNLISK